MPALFPDANILFTFSRYIDSFWLSSVQCQDSSAGYLVTDWFTGRLRVVVEKHNCRWIPDNSDLWSKCWGDMTFLILTRILRQWYGQDKDNDKDINFNCHDCDWTAFSILTCFPALTPIHSAQFNICFSHIGIPLSLFVAHTFQQSEPNVFCLVVHYDECANSIFLTKEFDTKTLQTLQVKDAKSYLAVT